MTDRLYYSDSYNCTFDATVLRVIPWNERREQGQAGGDASAAILDRTAFYPTSGGQPFDTGTLGPARVVDVVETADGEIAHVLSSETPSPQAGEPVHGTVDWRRRFDHMQQHTGQHVLSAAFDRLFGIKTVSFHLGAGASTIDLAREAARAELEAAEDEANRIVWENRPVYVRTADAAEAAAMPLRKESKRSGMLRLIEIDRFDLSACGGTHVATTGAIGIIGVTAWERFKGGQRVEFVCGNRALTRLRALRDATAENVRLLSVLPGQVPAAIARLQSESKEQRRAIARLDAELAGYRASQLAAGATRSAIGRLVLAEVDADPAGLKAIAAAIVAQPGFAAVLLSSANPHAIVAARSEGVPCSARQIVATLTARFGGRGGGSEDLAQGGGLGGDSEAILNSSKIEIESRTAK